LLAYSVKNIIFSVTIRWVCQFTLLFNSECKGSVIKRLYHINCNIHSSYF